MIAILPLKMEEVFQRHISPSLHSSPSDSTERRDAISKTVLNTQLVKPELQTCFFLPSYKLNANPTQKITETLLQKTETFLPLLLTNEFQNKHALRNGYSYGMYLVGDHHIQIDG